MAPFTLYLAMAHNPEDSAGAQLAMFVALKLLLTPYRGKAEAIKALEDELERVRADILASGSTDRKLDAFNIAAEGLMDVIRPRP